MSGALKEQAQVLVDAGQWTGELPHTWNYFGYDECNYTCTPEGWMTLQKLGNLEKPYYVRAHFLLCTGNLRGAFKWGSTNAYREDAGGNPVYCFDEIDRQIDTWLSCNLVPFFELGFMPHALADTREAQNGKYYEMLSNISEYQRIGCFMPPKDYQKWHDLVFALVTHCLSRYGAREVRRWYWELWNEPDIFYWRGSLEEYCKLFDYTEAAVHGALPEARLGGPAVTGERGPGASSEAYLRGFLDHTRNGVNFVTGAKGTRLDFTSFHTKGTLYQFELLAQKQLPTLRRLEDNVRTHAAILKEYGYDGLECVLSEADPDGWAAGGRYDNANLNFRNTEYYASFTAAAHKRIYDFAESAGMDLRPLTWAFLFDGERCFEGTRTLTTQGIDKPVMNLLRLYAMLGRQRVSLRSSRACDTQTRVEIDGYATIGGVRALQVLLYAHHDDWEVVGETEVQLEIERLPFEGPVVCKHYRIDGEHSNAYAEWVRQGMPDYPTEGQIAQIKRREQLELCCAPEKLRVTDGRLCLRLSLPAHAVSLISIACESER